MGSEPLLPAAGGPRDEPWDEMVDGRGRVRPQWHHLLATLGSLPGEGIEERARRLALPHHQEGLLFPTAVERADELPARCPLPVPLPAAEWEGLQVGLQQRARLLDCLLEDLYGPQHLLAHGDLPSYLVFANPAFLRACRRPGRSRERLRFCAADLFRGIDGRWRVLADVTGLPHGIGAARENRRLLSRVLPELFAGAHVRPLHPFFDLWVDSLRRLAAPERENPHLALLTPGLRDPAWPEHVFLARELGLSLVEDGDLTVRGGRVLLKTLRGLEPIDVLLRFADSDGLDPLELAQDGARGVAGLLDAHRTGAVTITNPPGSRLLETPGIYAFLPRLCRLLLGEELLLPQHPQWWCGDRATLMEFLASPDRFELRSAIDPRAVPVRLADLDEASRAVLLDRLQARPWDWICLEPPALSTVPCQEGPHRQPRRLVLRTFMVADEKGPEVMPGGLASALADGASPFARAHRHSLSKDVWILSQDEDATPSIRPSTAPPLPIRRMIGALPSRVADDFYWLGRYVERLDDVARLSRAVVLRLSRAALLPRDLAEVSQLARALAAAGTINADFIAPADGAILRDALRFAWRSPQGQLRGLLAEIERLSDGVRDRFSGDMLASVQHFLTSARRAAAASDTFDGQLDAAETSLRLATVLAGIAAENMVRGGSWLFLDLGRRIERASCQLRTLGVVLDLPPERLEMGLRLALELGDSVITYRNRYFSAVQLAPVVDLLLADASNPRALAYQLSATSRHLQELVVATGAEAATPGAEALQTDADRLLLPWLDGSGRAERVTELLDGLQRLQEGVMGLSDEIVRHYFAHVPAVHTVGFAEAAAE